MRVEIEDKRLGKMCYETPLIGFRVKNSTM